jgi:protein-histidine pros-kinase
MRLRTKFNLVLIVVFTLSLSVAGFISYHLLYKNARESALRNAAVMMEAAMSVRNYTIQQIKPLLEMQLRRGFLPQSVPAYAATETFHKLREKYPDYIYKEATLNPTNPHNRATDWETDIVNEFRNNPGKYELVSERETPTGRLLYLAHPIQVKNEACLACHSTPDQAPQSMIKVYGTVHGFGWKLNEIVGAQIVSVPMSIAAQQAAQAFYTFMLSLTGVFVLLFIIVNILLSRLVSKPLSQMSRLANEISMGNLDLPEFSENRRDEVGVLARSFNRMRRSLEKAMKLIEA